MHREGIEGIVRGAGQWARRLFLLLRGGLKEDSCERIFLGILGMESAQLGLLREVAIGRDPEQRSEEKGLRTYQPKANIVGVAIDGGPTWVNVSQ